MREIHLKIEIPSIHWMSVAAAMVLLASVIFHYRVYAEFLASDALFFDDLIYVIRYSFGINILPPANQTFYYGLIEYIVSNLSISHGKYFVYFCNTAIFILIFYLHARVLKNAVVASIIAATYLFLVIDVDQGLFMTGTHPMAGLLALYLTIVIFHHIAIIISKESTSLLSVILTSVAIFLTSCASYFITPLNTLTPYANAIILLTLLLIRPPRVLDVKSIIYGASALLILLVMAIVAIANESYHYTSLVGWVDLSPKNIFGNFLEFTRYWAGAYFLPTTITVLSIFLAVQAIIFCSSVYLYISNKSRDVMIIIIISTMLSGVVLVPGLATTAYIPRYAFISIVMMTVSNLSFVYFVVVSTGFIPGKYLFFLYLLGVGMVASLGVIWRSDVEHRVAGILRTHEFLESTYDGIEFPSESQSLVLLPEGYFNSTAGYNHWSTWYARLLTNDLSHIALVGNERTMKSLERNGLFVDQYEDHHQKFWEEVNGRSRRLRMLGLEVDRPTYVFQPESGNSVLSNLTLISDDGLISVLPGEIPASSDGVDYVKNICTYSENGTGVPNLLVPISDSEYVDFNDESGQLDWEVEFEIVNDQVKDIELNWADSELGKIVIEIHWPDDLNIEIFDGYDAHFPKMPFINSFVAAYQINQFLHFNFGSANETILKSSILPGGKSTLSLTKCGTTSSQIIASVDGGSPVLLNAEDLDTLWTLGKGYQQRFWNGRLTIAGTDDVKFREL